MTFLWKSEMREDDEPLRGQVAMQRDPRGGVYLVVMPAPNTFAADAVISLDDARALRDALTELVGDSR